MDKDEQELVTLSIPRVMAIALFEWSYSFMTPPHRLQFTHPADAVAIDRLASELEWTLKEPYTDSYPQILKAARESIVQHYRDQMGEKESSWLSDFEYRDGDSAQQNPPPLPRDPRPGHSDGEG